jgi:hypothetical protein
MGTLLMIKTSFPHFAHVDGWHALHFLQGWIFPAANIFGALGILEGYAGPEKYRRYC